MKQELAHIALVVDDYDEAIDFYTKKLRFTLIEDTVLSATKRWVIVSPPGSPGCSLLLAKAASEEQRTRIGNTWKIVICRSCRAWKSTQLILLFVERHLD